MNSSPQQSITNAVLSAVATAVAAIETRHKNEMLAFWEMIEKSLLLTYSVSAILPLDPDAAPKILSCGDSLPKAPTERWN